MNHARIAAGLFVMSGLAVTAVAAAASATRSAAITIVSGTPQTATAYVAQHGPRFETTFDAALVVKTVPKDVTVRFRCITHDCQFAPSEQPVANRVDPGAFDYKTKNGTASIKLIISTVTVETVTVSATVMGGPHPPSVTFHLIAR